MIPFIYKAVCCILVNHFPRKALFNLGSDDSYKKSDFFISICKPTILSNTIIIVN